MMTSNIFNDIPEYAPTELFKTLIKHPSCRIERIVSYGQSSPEGFWYDQTWDEWVLLLQGAATLDLDGDVVALRPGDHKFIPAGVRHRVQQTALNQPTIWLAVHMDGATAP